MTGRAPAWLLGALALLGLLGWWGGDRVRREAWTTSDEPLHVAAVRELRSGPGVVSNFEHPVLMKVVGAAGIGAVRAPRAIDESRNARTFFPAVFALLVVVTGFWAALRSGPWAGMAVAAVLVAEPTIRGHAALVTSDVLIALFLVGAAFLLDLSDASTSAGRGYLLAAGVVYGLAMAAKYSALPFLAVFAAVAFLRLRRPRRPFGPVVKSKKKAVAVALRIPAGRAAALVLAAVVVPSFLTAAGVQELTMAGTSRESLVAGIRNQFARSVPLEQAVWLGEHLPKGMAGYGAGLLWVKVSSVPGFRLNYFFGSVSGKGHLAYFPVALAVKLTTSTVLALLAAVAALALLAVSAVRSRGQGPGGRHIRRLLAAISARSGVPGLLAAAYLGAAAISDVNIGVRHVLPCLPLGVVAAVGIAATFLGRRRRVFVAVLALVVLSASAEALRTAGREIPFGNLFVGGPSGTRRVLSDSNADWGEAQGWLFERVRAGGLGRVAVVAPVFDAEVGEPLGMTQVDALDQAPADTVAASVFMIDLGHALRENTEEFPKIAWMRSWIVPLVEEIELRATSTERLGDEYVLYRLGPPGGKPTAPPP